MNQKNKETLEKIGEYAILTLKALGRLIKWLFIKWVELCAALIKWIKENQQTRRPQIDRYGRNANRPQRERYPSKQNGYESFDNAYIDYMWGSKPKPKAQAKKYRWVKVRV